MMIVDKILDWARGRGYTAVYGSAEQVNEMLNNTPFSASNDATAVIMHLVTDSATVDGKDTSVVAVYFASLCDFDFDGESLLPEQERLKGIGKELLNDIRTGNEMTYNDPRWQYGYDDYAENVCWVCLRVTLTASAADCVPLSPEPPTPPVDYMYFEAVEANSTVALTSTLTTAPNLEYSTDGETWQEWQHTTAEGTHTFDTLTLTAVGDRVYLRGDNPNGLGALPEGAESPLYSHFEMTGKIAAGGNIMSLLDKTMAMTVVPAMSFVLLFGDITEKNPNTSIISAATMSSLTAIGNAGCTFMYRNCTSLTTAATMSSLTAIGDYGCSEMYSGCDSLTSAAAMPLLTTIGDYGCSGMYYDCTSLTSAAAMPLLTTIGDHGCEEMYYGCDSLTSAAAMPSLTTIGDLGCEEMYSGCTFNMSDDGTNLNFAFPTPPVTAGEETYATAYDVAQLMGNTNGFTNP